LLVSRREPSGLQKMHVAPSRRRNSVSPRLHRGPLLLGTAKPGAAGRHGGPCAFRGCAGLDGRAGGPGAVPGPAGQGLERGGGGAGASGRGRGPRGRREAERVQDLGRHAGPEQPLADGLARKGQRLRLRARRAAG